MYAEPLKVYLEQKCRSQMLSAKKTKGENQKKIEEEKEIVQPKEQLN